MQTALHIYGLVRELKDSIIGAILIETAFYKKEREAYLVFKTKEGVFALGLAYHPVGFGTFLLPRGKIQVDTSEKPWPFFQTAVGGTVQEVEQLGIDRLIRIDLLNGSEKFQVIIEATGPNGNFWLVDSDSRVIATLRHKKFELGEQYNPLPPSGRVNPFGLTPADLKSVIEKDRTLALMSALKKNIAGLDDNLILETFARVGLAKNQPASGLDKEALAKLAGVISELASHFEDYHHGFYYETPDGRAVYPFKLSSLTTEPTRYKSLSLAIYEAIKTRREDVSEQSEKEQILNAVEKLVKKINKKLGRIELDLADADRHEEYRKSAELLKINLRTIKKGMTSVELKDVYDSGGGMVRIKLDPAQSPAGNAEAYFSKYRKAKEARTLLARRREICMKELSSTRAMLAYFARDYDSAVKKYTAEIAEILPQAIEKRETAPRLPYKPYTLSTGVTIFVGRDGADNDSTTFGHAKPYELWFHTAQTPGSHVVMKYPDKNFQPSKSEIAETAAVAAYFSKAKNSRAVPVIYTERRYVRKPRRAKPGLVTVEREKMVMVEPRKPD